MRIGPPLEVERELGRGANDRLRDRQLPRHGPPPDRLSRAARHPQLRGQVLTLPAPSLASLNAEAPRPLAELCARCLAKSPADRPSSAGALADELAALRAPGQSGRSRVRSGGLVLGREDGAFFLCRLAPQVRPHLVQLAQGRSPRPARIRAQEGP